MADTTYHFKRTPVTSDEPVRDIPDGARITSLAPLGEEFYDREDVGPMFIAVIDGQDGVYHLFLDEITPSPLPKFKVTATVSYEYDAADGMVNSEQDARDDVESMLDNGDTTAGDFDIVVTKVDRAERFGKPDIIRAAAHAHLMSQDDFTQDQLRDLADALGVDHGDVEAIQEESVRGCSCGMGDYGAPGHDGHDGSCTECGGPVGDNIVSRKHLTSCSLHPDNVNS